jgi:hypothetical protein
MKTNEDESRRHFDRHRMTPSSCNGTETHHNQLKLLAITRSLLCKFDLLLCDFFAFFSVLSLAVRSYACGQGHPVMLSLYRLPYYKVFLKALKAFAENDLHFMSQCNWG